MSQIQPMKYVLLNAVTASATSSGFPVNGAGRLSLMVFATGVSSGNGVFTVQVTNDSALGWADYNRLTTNVTNTNAQTDARVASLTLSTNTTNFLFFPPGDTFNFIRTSVVRTTDGTYSAVLYVD